MLVEQEAGDLIAAASLGGAKGRLGPEVIGPLLPVPRLLVAYNADEAGERAAARLVDLTKRARRVKVPMGKDPTEMHQLGGRLRDWAALLVAKHGLPERPTVPEAYLAEMLESLRPTGTKAAQARLCKCGAPVAEGLLYRCADCADRLHAAHNQPEGSAAYEQ